MTVNKSYQSSQVLCLWLTAWPVEGVGHIFTSHWTHSYKSAEMTVQLPSRQIYLKSNGFYELSTVVSFGGMQDENRQRWTHIIIMCYLFVWGKPRSVPQWQRRRYCAQASLLAARFGQTFLFSVLYRYADLSNSEAGAFMTPTGTSFWTLEIKSCTSATSLNKKQDSRQQMKSIPTLPGCVQ